MNTSKRLPRSKTSSEHYANEGLDTYSNYLLRTPDVDEEVEQYDEYPQAREISLSVRCRNAKENWRAVGHFILGGAILIAFCAGLSYDPPLDQQSFMSYQHGYDTMYRVLLYVAVSSAVPYVLACVYWLKEESALFSEEIDVSRKARER